MTPWEDTLVRNMIYLTLLENGPFMDNGDASTDIGVLVDDFLRRGQKHFEKRYRDCTILETEWFWNFMKYSQPLQAIREYLYEKDKTEDSRDVFLDKMLQAVREYTVFDTRPVLSSEERVLREYFRTLILVVGNILRTFPGGNQGRDSTWQTDAAYTQALMDRDTYLSLAEEFLTLGGRGDWDRSSLNEYPQSVLRDRYDLVLLCSEYFNTMGDRTVREWISHLSGKQWEHDSAYYIMHRLRRHESSEIPETLRQYITQYYNRNIEEMDFYLEPSMHKTDEPNRRGLQIDVMIYFATHFSLEIPQNKTGELLFLCKYPPETGYEWLPAKYMPEAELSDRILRNLEAGIANETILSWHILYCTDHPDKRYTEVIARVARNQLRKKWVRQIAMKYTCREMDVDSACSSILPRMQGDMFFFVAEQYCRAGSEQLANMVWSYGEKYATHKLRCDVMLVHLQNRKGIDSFLNHIEKRHLLPNGCREYRAADAIRNINAPELADELERFFCLGLKDSFKDSTEDSILDAAADALIRMAASGAEEYNNICEIFERCMEKYGDNAWKCDKIRKYIQIVRSGENKEAAMP